MSEPSSEGDSKGWGGRQEVELPPAACPGAWSMKGGHERCERLAAAGRERQAVG